MLSVNVRECKHCGSIQETLDLIENKLYKMAQEEYKHLSFLAPKHTTTKEAKRLIRWKNILTNVFWNSKYYKQNYKTIISHIKSLI